MKNLFFIILLLPLSVYSQSTQEQIDSLRYYMHIDLNEYRSEYNSQKLEISDTLNKLAQLWAETMFKTKEFKHISETSADFYWATCVFFRKTKLNKCFFELIQHIQEYYQHYKCLQYTVNNIS